MKRTLLLLLAALLVVLGVALSRALLLEPQPQGIRQAPALEVDQRRVLERLGAALRIRSIATREEDAVAEARLRAMMDFVEERFRSLQAHCAFERHRRSLVIRWTGSDATLDPLLLLAHLDVVPVDPATAADWRFPPFDGEVSAGYVWGRGALDDKSSALAMLEAIEHLALAGFRPTRGVVVALGCDEEIGGEGGAAAQARRFEAAGLTPFLVLDEGYGVLEGIVDVVPAPIAGVGVAEKGYLTVELRVAAAGGHASMPEPQSALGVLAAGLAALEAEPLPARLDGASAAFFDALAAEMPFGPKVLFANRWLTEPVLRGLLEAEPSTAALLRTTTAVTQANAGVAENVLPQSATATVNFRVHPRDSVADVVAHVVRVIDDERVEVRQLDGAREPTPTSPSEGEAWDLLADTIRECYEGVVVAPALVLGGTDARHYQDLSANVYRFNGVRLGPEDLARIHGANERIATKNYIEMIRFYARLIENASRL